VKLDVLFNGEGLNIVAAFEYNANILDDRNIVNNQSSLEKHEKRRSKRPFQWWVSFLFLVEMVDLF